VVPPIDPPVQPVVGADASNADPGSGSVAPPIDALPVATLATIHVFPKTGAEYQIAGETLWIPIADTGMFTLPLTKPTEITVENRTRCCQPTTFTTQPGEEKKITTAWLPATVIAHCKDATADVSIDGRPAKLDVPTFIPLKELGDRTKTVKVVFTSEHTSTEPKVITVTAAGTQDVSCDVR